MSPCIPTLFTQVYQERYKQSLLSLNLPNWLAFLRSMEDLPINALGDVIEFADAAQTQDDRIYDMNHIEGSDGTVQASLLGYYALSQGWCVKLHPRKTWVNTNWEDVNPDCSRDWLTEWFMEDMNIERELADLLYCGAILRSQKEEVSLGNLILLMQEIADCALQAQRLNAPGNTPLLDQLVPTENIQLQQTSQEHLEMHRVQCLKLITIQLDVMAISPDDACQRLKDMDRDDIDEEGDVVNVDFDYFEYVSQSRE